jgi:hypothetical protein
MHEKVFFILKLEPSKYSYPWLFRFLPTKKAIKLLFWYHIIHVWWKENFTLYYNFIVFILSASSFLFYFWEKCYLTNWKYLPTPCLFLNELQVGFCGEWVWNILGCGKSLKIFVLMMSDFTYWHRQKELN